MYLREAVNRFRALIGAVTKLGLCICKFDSEKVSASPATNLTARHWLVFNSKNACGKAVSQPLEQNRTLFYEVRICSLWSRQVNVSLVFTQHWTLHLIIISWFFLSLMGKVIAETARLKDWWDSILVVIVLHSQLVRIRALIEMLDTHVAPVLTCLSVRSAAAETVSWPLCSSIVHR